MQYFLVNLYKKKCRILNIGFVQFPFLLIKQLMVMQNLYLDPKESYLRVKYNKSTLITLLLL